MAIPIKDWTDILSELMKAWVKILWGVKIVLAVFVVKKKKTEAQVCIIMYDHQATLKQNEEKVAQGVESIKT